MEELNAGSLRRISVCTSTSSARTDVRLGLGADMVANRAKRIAKTPVKEFDTPVFALLYIGHIER
jgi:hypothetical protein